MTALEYAKRCCFFFGTGDVGQRLCEENITYGLAKIHHVQRSLGLPADASFVAAPDTTVSRNVERWDAGFGYGGRIRYSGDFVTLDIKTNLCGMLLVGLDQPPELEGLLTRIHDLKQQRLKLEGIDVLWDLGTSNHFISVLDFDKPVAGFSHAALIHGSGAEMRGEGSWGPGLYLSRSPALRKAARTLKTPWGPLSVLMDGDAVDYLEGVARIEGFIRARRVAIAERLFPDNMLVLSDTTHQGIQGPGDYHLGCLVNAGPGPVPIALRADLPIAVVEPLPSIKPEVLDREGVMVRAVDMDLDEALFNANILPHGGGYTYPQYRDVERVIELGQTRYFVMKPTTGTHPEVIANPRSLPFTYRGYEVVDAVERYELGRLVTLGRPRFVFMV